MSEQKGSYAHVGLPGLRELFFGGGKGMKEREIRSILHDGTEVVFNTGDRVLFQASRPGGMPLAIDADSLVDDLILTLEQRDTELTVKDATIKSLKEDKRKIYATYEEQCARGSEYYNENIRLRKALAVARYDIKQIAKYPDDKEYSARSATLALEQINAALGEEASSSLPNCPHCGKNDRLLPHWEKSNLWACIHCSQPFDTGEGDKE